MVETIRLAIAGYGLVGRRHAAAIGGLSGVELHSVIEPGEAARQAALEQGLRCFETLEDFLSFGGADGVILATPNALHVEQALACVSFGCPVLVEKPIATKPAEAEGLVQTADRLGVPLLVGHHRRHNPLIERAKAAIEAGQIGEVRAVQATCWFYKPDDYFEIAEWRKKPGAGPVSVNLVHDVDLIRFLCGEILKVHATVRPSARGYDIEDVAGALLDLDNGAVGMISVSDSIVAPWSWELTSREYPVYPPTPESCYLIGGSHGSLSVPDMRLWHYADGRRDWWAPISATSLPLETTDPLVNQIENFASVIRGVTAPLVSGWEGLQTLRVVEAIQRSAASGQSVRLEQAVRAHKKEYKNI